MIQKIKHATFSMKLTVISLFAVLSLLIISVALSLQYYFSQSLAKQSASLLFESTARRVSEQIQSLDIESSDLAKLLALASDDLSIDNQQVIRPITRLMAQAMRQKPYLYAIYIGYQNGNFYELINLDSSDKVRVTLNAKPIDRWLVVHIHDTDSGRQRQFYYFDQEFELTGQHSEPSQYFANVRPWYRDAMNSDTTIKTEPYIFHNTQSPGTTYAQRIDNSDSVMAVDISLETLSSYLQKSRISSASNIVIFNRSGKVFAHSYGTNIQDNIELEQVVPLSQQEQQYVDQLGVLRVSNERNWPPFDFSYSGQPQGYSIDLVNLLSKKLGLSLEYSNGYNWDELVTLFHQQRLDIIHSVFYTTPRKEWGLFTDSYLTLIPSLAVLNSSPKNASLAQLNLQRGSVAIPAGWAMEDLVKTHFPEIKIYSVGDTLQALQAVQNGQADAALDNYRVIQYFIERYKLTSLTQYAQNQLTDIQFDQQLRLLVHDDQPQLHALLNRAIQSITTDELAQIEQKWLGNAIHNKAEQAINAGVVPDPVFVELAKQSERGDAITHSVMIGDIDYTLFVHQIDSLMGSSSYLGIIIPRAVIEGPYMERVHLSIWLTVAVIILLVPVLVLFSNMIITPVKQLADENQKIIQRRFKEVRYIPSQIREIKDLSNSIYSMAESIEDYQQRQRELMDGFIKLVARAIDEKSPYTGGHCARVPELAIMLAQSAENSDLPAFKQFTFADDDQRREFQVAAWLHDCGKVTTPEHIIDKGTKLETIYNRIHEVRLRFEILWRDAELLYWQAVANGENREELLHQLEQRKQEIEGDFSFIAQCNVGSEFLDEDKMARIEQIAQRTWTRHLDNRLGLSPQESKRLQSIPSVSLPAEERLLADLPEHIIEWPQPPEQRFSIDIKMDIPGYQSNLGEIHNLKIQRGTLCEEDRFRINEHIIATIQMLEALPFPPELARVPEIAGGHHETLDGNGYPKKLTKDQLSIEARILAIADVFEALTAADRPYKEAKTLSQAIEILATMVKEQHLDEDLFKLFLSSGVYRQYASYYLTEQQIDEVDLNLYL